MIGYLSEREPMSRMKNSLILMFSFCLFVAPQAHAQQLSKLPYVPTPKVVVDEMLKLANFTGKDFVVDLGSGDGRMIITAAKNFKASGMGVDIDSKLVELSNQEAKAQGVDD